MILAAAGNQANFPNVDSDISIDGIINDHIEAATIMPPANPKNKELILCEISFLKKNTKDEPNVVIKNMIEKPIIIINVLFISKLIDTYTYRLVDFYFANSAMTTVKLLANNLTANANKMTPKNLRKIKIMSFPNHFSILPTKRMTIYAKVRFRNKPNIMLITE